jgi:hypothetical protein
MARLYGRAGHLTDENGDFRPGQCKNRFSNQHSRAGKRGADPADRVCAGCGAQLPPLGDQDHCDGCSRALGREAGPAGAGGSNYVKPEPEGGGASAGEWAEAPWAGGGKRASRRPNTVASTKSSNASSSQHARRQKRHRSPVANQRADGHPPLPVDAVLRPVAWPALAAGDAGAAADLASSLRAHSFAVVLLSGSAQAEAMGEVMVELPTPSRSQQALNPSSGPENPTRCGVCLRCVWTYRDHF